MCKLLLTAGSLLIISGCVSISTCEPSVKFVNFAWPTTSATGAIAYTNCAF